ncbi:hypothetical protein EAO76_24445 [Streptomyces sp. sk2.1]|nr:hypothetical protein EAO76_24445 [Streptomyces sp. sk2.1]
MPSEREKELSRAHGQAFKARENAAMYRAVAADARTEKALRARITEHHSGPWGSIGTDLVIVGRSPGCPADGAQLLAEAGLGVPCAMPTRMASRSHGEVASSSL